MLFLSDLDGTLMDSTEMSQMKMWNAFINGHKNMRLDL